MYFNKHTEKQELPDLFLFYGNRSGGFWQSIAKGYNVLEDIREHPGCFVLIAVTLILSLAAEWFYNAAGSVDLGLFAGLFASMATYSVGIFLLRGSNYEYPTLPSGRKLVSKDVELVSIVFDLGMTVFIFWVGRHFWRINPWIFGVTVLIWVVVRGIIPLIQQRRILRSQ